MPAIRLRRRCLGLPYGAATEWYQGNWTLRGGLFDLSIVPNSTELDPTFREFQWIGEIERRYDFWGHPGKIAVTGFLSRGGMGTFANAIALAAVTGGPADIAAVRQYQSRGGVAMNLEQEITSDLGVFIRAGWADGSVQPYEYTDVDRTIAGGVSIAGKQWADPTTRSASRASSTAFPPCIRPSSMLASGNSHWRRATADPGLEQIIETYYSYALTASTRVWVD